MTPSEGDTQLRQRSNRQYGNTQTDTFHLPKGSKYKITLKHIGTNPRYRGTPKPDYDYTLEFDDSAANGIVIEDLQGITGEHWESTPYFAEGRDATLYVPSFEWITPKGSPVTAPDDIGDGKNEFAYDSTSNGVLTIDLKVLVKPSGTAGITDRHGAIFADRCIYSLPSITGSTFAWDAANMGGTANANGNYLLGKATYTSLPYNNNEFGAKQASFSYATGTNTLPIADFEIFFNRDAENHPQLGPYPGPRPRNWYYYWSQTLVGHPDIQYEGNAPNPTEGAITVGIRNWNYATPVSKTQIFVYNYCIEKWRAYGVGENFSGIDNFTGTIFHELKHVEQIVRADVLLPTNGADSFRYGWSWNPLPHNHWAKGPDNAWGVVGVDDDSDSIIDNSKIIPNFEAGQGDDVSLQDPAWLSWPSAWPYPTPSYPGLHPIENEAVNFADSQHDENKSARLDWGSPGKNHKTIDKYDD